MGASDIVVYVVAFPSSNALQHASVRPSVFVLLLSHLRSLLGYPTSCPVFTLLPGPMGSRPGDRSPGLVPPDRVKGEVPFCVVASDPLSPSAARSRSSAPSSSA